MSRYHAYVRNAATLVQAYDGKVPLASFLKQYFSTHKKFGSTDRRVIGALCHQYYRLGHWLADVPTDERILVADLLCNTDPTIVIKELKPEWLPLFSLSLAQKVHALGYEWDVGRHTPWLHLLQPQIGQEDYISSFFERPDLFLRCRPGKEALVQRKLEQAGLPAHWPYHQTIRLPNGTRIDDVLEPDRDVVVQDLGSQQCGHIIYERLPDLKGTLWDACAASGGKSIQLHDLYHGQLDLVVTDIRESILVNLRERFRKAGLRSYNSFIADLTKEFPKELEPAFADVILVDAPCTGSGTWARTPEQHYFFQPNDLSFFADRQKAICQNVMPGLKAGGYLIYITCAVFSRENNEVVQWLTDQLKLDLIAINVIDGTRRRSDSMFLAMLRKGQL